MATPVTTMDFVPMASIEKKPDAFVDKCTNWVATEKVHGSSFQIYTSDGLAVNVGSRRQTLDKEGSFIKCNIRELLKENEAPALRMWHILNSDDRWARYREPFDGYNEDDDDDDGEEDNKDNDQSRDNVDSEGGEDQCQLRIYGELYGGGGVAKGVKSAVQKEIIYCDDFRFYVFGLTVNQKWLTISELGDLCKDAGFPYYARPVCEPRNSMEELKQHLLDSGFMRTRSSVTDKQDDVKTAIEGVVMTPLSRPDYRLHAVKFLAPAFNDVRDAQFCSTKNSAGPAAKKPNYCTKQRYHSVISKLDTHERQDTSLVVNMFISDIIKESGETDPPQKLKDVWTRLVTQWLVEDEYAQVGGGEEKKRKGDKGTSDKQMTKKENEHDEEDDGPLMFLE